MLLFSPSSNSFPKAESLFQQEVFDFCRAWNAGQRKFQFHTSGSTGTPKSIIIDREKMIYSANLTSNWLGLQEQDIALLCLPIQYIAGAMMLVRALVLDLNILVIDPQLNLLENLREVPIEIDFASFVPNQWIKLVEDKSTLFRLFGQSKGVLLGGAPLDLLLEKKTSEFTFPVFHTYAMTETVSHIAYRKIAASNFEPIYTVFSEIDIDSNFQNCLKLKSFLTDDQWIVTSDLVEIKNATTFRLLGRSDFVINSAGFKIFPQKVESFCQAFFEQEKLVTQLFVFGIKDEVFGQKAILFVEKEKALSIFEHLKVFLITKLDKKEIPKECIFIPEFQLSSNGKIDQIKTVNLYLNNS
jgi:O-succinylbenzoic acid--CoA ligase